jgi:hypothetical protein
MEAFLHRIRRLTHPGSKYQLIYHMGATSEDGTFQVVSSPVFHIQSVAYYWVRDRTIQNQQVWWPQSSWAGFLAWYPCESHLCRECTQELGRPKICSLLLFTHHISCLVVPSDRCKVHRRVRILRSEKFCHRRESTRKMVKCFYVLSDNRFQSPAKVVFLLHYW